MKIEPLFLDIAPAYISFEFQSAKGDGTAIDPTGTPTVTIFEETGIDGAFDNTQITGSPFNLAKINSETGNYGVLVAKSAFTSGRLYRVVYKATVDGIATRKVELLQACNASQFKATGFAVPGDAMTLTVAYDAAKVAASQASVNGIPTNPLLTNDFRLNNLDATISSRSTLTTADIWSYATRTLTDKTGFGLSNAERISIANEVEAQIIDDTDTEKVLQAITDKIAAANPSLNGLTLSAIASAIRAELTTELTRIDAAVSSRLASSGYTAPDNTSIAAIKVVTDKFLFDINNFVKSVQQGNVGVNSNADMTAMKSVLDKFLFDANSFVKAVQQGGVTLDAAQRVKLDMTQPDYAPAKAGDAMSLTPAYDPAKTAAQPGEYNTALAAIVTDLNTIKGYTDTVETLLVAIQTDLGDPSADTTTLYAMLQAIKAKSDKLTFNISNEVLAQASATISNQDKTDIANTTNTILSTAHGAGAWGSGSGSGVNTVTITVRDNISNALIPDVAVVILDIEGNLRNTAKTDVNGNAVVNLDSGSYVVKLQKTQVNFSPSYALTVTGSGTVILKGDLLAFPIPSAPGMCILIADLVTLGMLPKSGVKLTATLKHVPKAVGGLILDNTPWETTTQPNGRATLEVPQGVVWNVDFAPLGMQIEVDTTGHTSINISSLL